MTPGDVAAGVYVYVCVCVCVCVCWGLEFGCAGGNPCLEQTLESCELCCLVETFPHRHSDLKDFIATLRAALLYAKTVTLGPTHWPSSNAVMARNRCRLHAWRVSPELPTRCPAPFAYVVEFPTPPLRRRP